MSAKTPEALQELIEQFFNAHDLDGVTSLYEDGNTLVVPQGEGHGKEGVRQIMSNFVALKPTFKYTAKQVFKCDDIALLGGKWTLNGTGPDGSPVEMAGQTAEVARKQADGTWLYAVDSPFGFFGL